MDNEIKSLSDFSLEGLQEIEIGLSTFIHSFAFQTFQDAINADYAVTVDSVTSFPITDLGSILLREQIIGEATKTKLFASYLENFLVEVQELVKTKEKQHKQD